MSVLCEHTLLFIQIALHNKLNNIKKEKDKKKKKGKKLEHNFGINNIQNGIKV